MSESTYSLDEAIEWRIPVWKPPVEWALNEASRYLAPDSHVLEMGYCSGAMSRYLVMKYDWKMTGHEVLKDAQEKANKALETFPKKDRIKYLLVSPGEDLGDKELYDGIFIKSFLFHARSEAEYLGWIRNLHARLKPGGVLIGIENAKGTMLTQFYRNKLMKDCSWKDNTFFEKRMEEELREIFSKVELKYFWSWSQFTSFSRPVHKACAMLENITTNIDSKNAFICSFMAVK